MIRTTVHHRAILYISICFLRWWRPLIFVLQRTFRAHLGEYSLRRWFCVYLLADLGAVLCSSSECCTFASFRTAAYIPAETTVNTTALDEPEEECFYNHLTRFTFVLVFALCFDHICFRFDTHAQWQARFEVFFLSLHSIHLHIHLSHNGDPSGSGSSKMGHTQVKHNTHYTAVIFRTVERELDRRKTPITWNCSLFSFFTPASKLTKKIV